MFEQPVYKYHLFISYADADRSWVERELLPRIKQADLNYIDPLEFVLGRPEVAEVERAVRESRRTLLILSNNYIEDLWQEFADILSSSYGRKTREWRSIPVIIDDEVAKDDYGILPERLRGLVRIELFVPDEENWKRLIRELNVPLTTGTQAAEVKAEVQANKVITGIDALWKMIQEDPDAYQSIVVFRGAFHDARKEIEVISDYKRLHDQLHNLQLGCYENIVTQCKHLPDEKDDLALAAASPIVNSALNTISMMALFLGSIIGGMRDIIDQNKVDAVEAQWVAKLEGAQQMLEASVALDKKLKIMDICAILKGELDVQPSRINARLKIAVAALRLPKLIEAMDKVCNELCRINKDRAENKVKQFRTSICSLNEINIELGKLLQEHDDWQRVDDELRMLETYMEKGAANIELFWPILMMKVTPLYESKDEPWAKSLEKTEQELREAISVKQPDRAQQIFHSYRARCATHFFDVDRTMKNRCDSLRKIGEELAKLDDELENM